METPANPFPGLRPYGENETDIFFGRDQQSDELVDRLAARRFLAVLGASGRGKSALVRAGLLPSLRSGFLDEAGSKWRIAVLRPGHDPIGNLVDALNQPDVMCDRDLGSAASRLHLADPASRETLRRRW